MAEGCFSQVHFHWRLPLCWELIPGDVTTVVNWYSVGSRLALWLPVGLSIIFRRRPQQGSDCVSRRRAGLCAIWGWVVMEPSLVLDNGCVGVPIRRIDASYVYGGAGIANLKTAPPPGLHPNAPSSTNGAGSYQAAAEPLLPPMPQSPQSNQIQPLPPASLLRWWPPLPPPPPPCALPVPALLANSFQLQFACSPVANRLRDLPTGDAFLSVVRLVLLIHVKCVNEVEKCLYCFDVSSSPLYNLSFSWALCFGFSWRTTTKSVSMTNCQKNWF